MTNNDPSLDVDEDKQAQKFYNRRVHMANERTFLAWIRTSIGIMAFGFVLEKFALFTKQMALLMGQQHIAHVSIPSHGYSAILGISLVMLGTVMSAVSFIRYRKVQKQIDTETWHSSYTLDAVLTFFVVIIGILLVVYLVYSHTRV
jgi:putative membrane protein